MHTALVGARWPHEVDRNLRVANDFVGEIDLSAVPLRTAGIYEEQDRRLK